MFTKNSLQLDCDAICDEMAHAKQYRLKLYDACKVQYLDVRYMYNAKCDNKTCAQVRERGENKRSENRRAPDIHLVMIAATDAVIVYTLLCDIHNECTHFKNYSMHSIPLPEHEINVLIFINLNLVWFIGNKLLAYSSFSLHLFLFFVLFSFY